MKRNPPYLIRKLLVTERNKDPVSPPKTDLDGIATGGVHLLALLLALSPSGYWCGIPHGLLAARASAPRTRASALDTIFYGAP